MNDPSMSETLRELSTGSISSSISKLSNSSRVFPSDKDFHFYYNFDEFKTPIDEIASKSWSMLQEIGSSKHLWGGKDMTFPEDIDDDAYDWLVNVNDEVMDRFDSSVDEYTRLRKAKEEEGARIGNVVDEDGFQLVRGRKKRGNGIVVGMREKEESAGSPRAGVRVAEKDKKTVGAKPKVPFHIPTIKRPQDEFHILVNNGNEPFQHVWLESSDDGSRVFHPLENLSILDFVDQNVESLEPEKPPPMESTPFKLVGEVKDLKELASKLRNVNEFAVDLEHNQYRSFQGLTCLMQISTRAEDFVIDTLKLRIHIGPYLREVFRDPTKRKVMHGADRDIAWLQRDFGIYICNLFDTGQASRVLQMERNSLEHLLQHFCGVSANKEYQNADWRLRPLPGEMIRYAREDTHYLLYIYDLMKIRLLSESMDPTNSDTLLLEVYKRSYDICLQLYEKELLTETSYLYIYGVQAANLNAQQLSVVAGLCEWRDTVARAEDESTGYVLPNKTLLEIAKQMPLTTNKLRRLVRSKHPYVERNLSPVVNIITHSVENASSFESVAGQLKEGRIQAPELNDIGADSSEVHATGYFNREGSEGNQHKKNCKPTGHDLDLPKNRGGASFEDTGKNDNVRKGVNGSGIYEPGKEHLSPPTKKNEISACVHSVHSEKVTEATVQVLKKPNRAFGALLGSSASKTKTDFRKEKGDKLEQIKSSVNLPFYPFLHKDLHSNQSSEQASEESKRVSHTSVYGDQPTEPALDTTLPEDRISTPASSSKLDDIILFDSDSHDEAPQVDSTEHQQASKPESMVHQYDNDDDRDDDDDCDEDEPTSLSGLASSFQKCLQSVKQNQTTKQGGKSKEAGGWMFKPFDYDAAREEVKFGEAAAREARRGNAVGKNMGKKKGGGRGGGGDDRSNQDESGLPQGRRRQAFPASGNRSSTFR